MPDITHISQLTHDPRNARAHNPRNIGMIVDSLQEVGAARSIVIDEDGRILAGNGTIDAAGQAGIERVQVVDADGETIVAVRRTGLTPAQKTRLALADNRTAELATWDSSVLADLSSDKLLDGLFREDEIARILGTYEPIDPEELWKGMPEFEHEDQTADAAFTIRVFLKDAEDLAAFGRLLGKDLAGRKFVWFSKQPRSETYEVVE